MLYLTILFLGCFSFYLLFVSVSAYFFIKIGCSKVKIVDKTVSIIIPARNEEQNIQACLTSVLAQTYPSELIEVVLINDHSTDQTVEIAKKIEDKDIRLKIYNLNKGIINSYKKAAITQGINATKGEIILQTDADCIVSNTWVQDMVSQFEEQIQFVSGPVLLEAGNKLLEKFQAVEYMGLIGLGAGAMTAGFPNMCNGANMAYRRSAFKEVNGFEGIDQIASGDDELLMQKIHQRFPNTLTFAKCKGAIVKTSTIASWKNLKAQRIRWVSKARYYHNKWTNVVQLISYIAFWSFPFFAIVGCFDSSYVQYFLGICLLKLLVDLLIMVPAARFFHKLHHLIYLLPLQPVYIIYVLWIGIAGNFVNKYHWKERKVK